MFKVKEKFMGLLNESMMVALEEIQKCSTKEDVSLTDTVYAMAGCMCYGGCGANCSPSGCGSPLTRYTD